MDKSHRQTDGEMGASVCIMIHQKGKKHVPSRKREKMVFIFFSMLVAEVCPSSGTQDSSSRTKRHKQFFYYFCLVNSEREKENANKIKISDFIVYKCV